MTAPDHAENTGDNLRHAAEATRKAQEDETANASSPEQEVAANPPPDFNT